MRALGCVEFPGRGYAWLAVDGMVFLGDFALSGALGYSKDLHRYYIRDNDVTNVHVGFGLRGLSGN